MTDKQTALLEEMRMQGKGYKAIASAVGLSRDIVRNYCKAKGMEGYGETVALNMPRRSADVETDRTSQINMGRKDA